MSLLDNYHWKKKMLRLNLMCNCNSRCVGTALRALGDFSVDSGQPTAPYHELCRGLCGILPFPAFRRGQTLTLNEAIHLAEAHNRSVQIAQLDQRKAADEASVARSYRLPVFSLTAIGSQSLARLGLTFILSTMI